MVTIVRVSLALYPSEKHFQTENETGQLCCANVGWRRDITAATLAVGLGQTLLLTLNLGTRLGGI